MKQAIILLAIKMIVKMFPPEKLKEMWVHILEKLNKYVEGTNNKIDDFIMSAISGSTDELKVLVDFILDFIEDRVLGSASTVDDALVLPICDLLRTTFNIPDND